MNKEKTIKIFIPNTSHLVGKTLEEVKKEMEEKYISTGKYCFAKKDEVKNEDLPQDKYIWYYFFGSLVRYADGYWGVPYACRDGSKWHRGSRWFGNDWDSRYRVVLLEDSPDESLDVAIQKVKSAGYIIYKKI